MDARRLRFLALGLGVIGSFIVQARGDDVEYYNIPLLANIHEDAGITPAEVSDAVKQMNEIYKQARVRFTLVHAFTDVPNPGGSSTLDLDERNQARRDGEQELISVFGLNPNSNSTPRSGMKASFVGTPKAENANVNGTSEQYHPVIILRKHPEDPAKTGETMAHEFGHALGLTDLDAPGTEGRLMHGFSNERTGTLLTLDEIKEISDLVKSRGIVERRSTTGGTSVSSAKLSGFGASEFTTPPRPGHFVGTYGSITQVEGEEGLRIELALGGPVPAAPGPFPAMYFMLFDTDGSAATGMSFSPDRVGIDKMVQVMVIDSTHADAFMFAFTPVMTPVPGTAPVQLTGVQEFFDDPTALPPLPAFPITNGHMSFEVIAEALGLSDPDGLYNVVVASMSPFSEEAFDIITDARVDLDLPELLESNGGAFGPESDSLHILGRRYNPMELVDIFVDDLLVATWQADALGELDEMLELPDLAPADFYFVTGLGQSSGAFDFLVIGAVPEPAVGWLAAAVLVLGRRRGGRRRDLSFPPKCV